MKCASITIKVLLLNKSKSFLFKILIATVTIIVLAVGGLYASIQLGANSQSSPPGQNQLTSTTQPTTPTDQPSSTQQTTTPQTTLAPTATQTTSATTGTSGPSATVTFDFDTASPILPAGRGLPLDQTKNGITAQISSPSGSSFSVQNYDTTFYKLAQFQGNYLLDNGPGRDIMLIKFSQPLIGTSFTFATIEYHGAANDEPTNVTLTAYMDSTLVGSGIARGTWPNGDSYPQGTLTYNSGNQPFNNIKIEIPFQGAGRAQDYIIDTIIVQTA